MIYPVTLPLPPIECSPNHRAATVRARIHQAQARAAYKTLVTDALKKAAIPPQSAIKIHLLFATRRAKRDTAAWYAESGYYFPRDDDNALGSFKWGRDALKEAGIVKDDAYPLVQIGRVELVKEAPARLLLLIEPI